MCPDDPSPLPSIPAPSREDSDTLAFLNRLTNAILGLSDPALIIARVERMLGEHLKVSRVLVAEAMDDGEHVNVQHTWSVPGMPEIKGIHRLDDYGAGIRKDYREGRMHIRRDAEQENQPGPELEALKRVGAVAAIDMPVLVDGEFRVLVVVHQNSPRDWQESEIALMRQVADRTAAEVMRARALKSAQESEFHFRQMADTMPQIVWGSKPDGVPDWFNQRWYDYTGLPHGRLRSEDWRAAFPQEDLIPMLRVWEEALRESKPHSVEARLRRAEDGMMRWHLVRANPVFDASGKVVRWYGTLTDIHDQKEAAEQTLQSEFRLSGALQMAALGSVNWNLKENRVDMDSRCRALFDFPADKALRVEDVFDKIAPDDRGRVETAAATSAKEGTLLEIEYTVLVEGRGPRLISSISRVSLGADGTPEHIYGVLGDVTERRRAEEKREEFIRMIEADRANLSAVVEKSPAFIAVLRGPDHILEVANEKYYELIGRTAQTGKPIREVLPEIEGQGFFEMLDEVYRSGKPTSGTEVLVTLQPEGGQSQDHYVNFVFQALLGPDKKPAGVFVHGVDVTEPVKAREAVAKSERGRRMALEAAQVGAYNINLLTKELQTNERFRRLIGCGDDELTYDNALATVHPEDMDRIEAAISAATRPVDPEPYATEYRVIHPDGSVHWMSARGGVTFEDSPEGRRPVSFDGTMSDITEQKQAEEGMAFQRHQLELIFRESPAAMALWRGEDFVFERVNPHYQALFGNRRLEGLPLLEAVPELRGQGFDAMLRDVLHTGKTFVGREVLARFARTPDGPVEDLYFDFSYLQVLDPDGKPWGVYDHAIDVTERVLARRALEESQEQLRDALAERQTLLDAERAARGEAEMAGRMKDEFLATLSHELRTPLNAIVGWTQLLQMMPDQSQRLSDGLAVIARNAKAQTQIIEDILDMSRIVSGKLRLDVQKVDLAALVKAGAETLETAADAKEVKLQVIVDPAAGNISGDPHRLHQVLWNLLSNAVKFTPKGGKVQVTLKRVNSNVEVSVADTGEGIAPEFLPHVFDRFRQADSSSTRHHGGLGLGLAIVKQIVELHGGSVRALSPGKGEGATFIVSLPISIAHTDTGKEPSEGEHPTAEVALPLTTLDPGQLSGVSIVAVDDEPDAVAFVERLLVGCGAVVHAATSVSQAYALVKTHSPMVIVSDIGMPGEDGYAFLRKVRELSADQGGRARALAVTAYARSVDRVRALEAGFQMHISKPVDPAELIASVAALANSYKNG